LLEGTEAGFDLVVNILANPHETLQPADDQGSREPRDSALERSPRPRPTNARPY
jgi:hypothetical protein